jgi:L-ribulose-5-phosphate 3-epimerase
MELQAMHLQLDRRTFCRAAAGAALAPGLLAAAAAAEPEPQPVRENAETAAGPFAGRIYKAVKVSMIQGQMPLADKFKLARDAGFEGISLFAPDRFDLKEAVQAQGKTGLMVHNVNNAVHWRVRLSDPDPEVRAASLDAMQRAIQFAHDVGASSILQVVGKVTDPKNENHQQVWDRSLAEIRKALPLAARLGVRILCENVGNGFCEDARQWAAYLDEIGSPWVGAFFDVGNHHRFGGADHWIRTLGRRIVKLDIKDHNLTAGRNCNLFEGDVDWAAVRRELATLEFTGWATAEVEGGGLERLREVAQRMDKALGL